jgi:hypothetical protein
MGSALRIIGNNESTFPRSMFSQQRTTCTHGTLCTVTSNDERASPLPCFVEGNTLHAQRILYLTPPMGPEQVQGCSPCQRIYKPR